MFPTTTIQKVSIPVLWDGNGNYKGGDLFSVNVDSVIGAPVAKPSEQTIPGYPVTDYTDTLEIKDPSGLVLYTTLTLSEYLSLIGSGETPPGNTLSITYTGGDNTGTGNIVNILPNIAILSLNKSGTNVYEPAYSYDVSGPLDLTDAGGLAEGEQMQLIYKNIS